MPPNSSECPARGIASQQSMSGLAMRAAQMHQSLVWKEHSEKMWVLVEVLSQDNTILRVRHQATDAEEEIDLVSARAIPVPVKKSTACSRHNVVIKFSPYFLRSRVFSATLVSALYVPVSGLLHYLVFCTRVCETE